MAQKSDTTSFWVSYGDLMTSLFFVMFVLVVILMVGIVRLRQEKQEATAQMLATKEQVRKVKELEEATKDLDEEYFDYDQAYKKFILKIPVQFRKGSADLSDISPEQQKKLLQAGRILHRFMQEKHKVLGIDFLLIVEGQASLDNYKYNRELSYARALSLYSFWVNNGLDFEHGEGLTGSEALVVGSGVYGKPRSDNEQENQRFLITLINKPGIIK